MRLVEELAIGLSESECVGIGSIWVAEEDTVVVELHAVETIALPLLVEHESQVPVSVAACYVGQGSKGAVWGKGGKEVVICGEKGCQGCYM